MPLEFALRPRFDLERRPRRRRLSWLRLPPLVLPISVYWLTIAGGTYALIQSFAGEASGQSAQTVAQSGQSVAVADERVVTQPLHIADVVMGDAEPLATTSPGVTALPPAVDAPAKRSSAASEPERENTQQALASRIAERDLVRREPPRVVQRELSAPPAVATRSELSEQPAPLRRELSGEVPHDATSRVEAQPVSLPSCESAAATANQAVDLRSARGAPDLTRDAFAAVLENGSYLNRCEIPGRTALEICAAVQAGKVVGVSVTTAPPNAAINACVRRAVAGLRFPRNSQLDVTRTHFAPAL